MLYDNSVETRSTKSLFLFWGLLGWIYPPFCCNCNQLGYEICPQCFSSVDLQELKTTCACCGKIISKGTICSDCNREPPMFDQLKSWAAYQGAAKNMITGIKYQRRLGLIPHLVNPLTETIVRWGIKFDMLVPVPLGRERMRTRGYNQSDLIAKPVAKKLNLPYSLQALIRIKETKSQVGLSAAERRNNLSGAFEADRSICQDKIVLLVDDIATTGATLNACAAALKQAGAVNVFCFTVARANSNQNSNQSKMEVSI
jgi:competence protein ComFC